MCNNKTNNVTNQKPHEYGCTSAQDPVVGRKCGECGLSHKHEEQTTFQETETVMLPYSCRLTTEETAVADQDCLAGTKLTLSQERQLVSISIVLVSCQPKTVYIARTKLSLLRETGVYAYFVEKSLRRSIVKSVFAF